MVATMIAHPTVRNRISIFGRMVKTRGIQATLLDYLNRLNNRLTNQRKQENRQPDGPPNRVDRFSQLSTPADLGIRSVHAKWGIHYAPSRKDIFAKAIRSLPIRCEDYVFIDLGAGKGEILLLAAEYGFRRVVGVEYSEILTTIASTNVRTAAGLVGKSVACICADAADFDFSPDPAVLYLYNPFQGKVMNKVIRNIEQSLRAMPRELWIIYVNPWEHRKFARSHNLKTIIENWDVPNWEFCIYRSIS
jgi:SAM-dependent methyltransferase